MNITIKHNQDTLDPSQTMNPEQFSEFLTQLEASITKEILKKYPDAEIRFSPENYIETGVEISGVSEDPEQIRYEIEDICSHQFELHPSHNSHSSPPLTPRPSFGEGAVGIISLRFI
jgi:hypothetical protein